jgi:glycine dehydrogenase
MPIELPAPPSFLSRHVGPDAHDIAEMLKVLGAPSLDALIGEVVPDTIRVRAPLNLPPARTEHDLLVECRRLASQNRIFRSYIGLGYSDCITPPVIQRNILENPGWYTQYTPYQAEIAQGRLEALLNFQTMIADLTGLPVANSSLLDEGTAAAEAMHMMAAVAPSADEAGRAFWVSSACHPQTIAVVRTRAEPLGIEVVVGDHRVVDQTGFDRKIFGALLQYPASDGAVSDYRAFIARAHDEGALVAVAADLLALAVLMPPGELGADVAVGSAQRFGVPLGYGGPHAAFFATRAEHVRKLPGRLIGVSQDAHGHTALRMALQTREQHIRREKATSNICTAQVLLAIISGMYAVYHGPRGIRAIAERVAGLTAILARGLGRLGVTVRHKQFFDTLRIEGTATEVAGWLHAAEAQQMNFGRIDAHSIGISLDETTSPEDVEAIWSVFRSEPNAPAAAGAGSSLTVAALAAETDLAWPAALARTSPYLTHPVFNAHHSETEMLRYIKRLETRDLSLVHSMIPLGSCTMKLNATAEMLPITWPEWGRLHPFAPIAQTAGYQAVFRQLESMLSEVTGFAGVSLQPNAGSQGELAGLLVIRKFHQSRGQAQRDVCLIPSSAHGTNPASAVLAGYRVVVVACDDAGNVDLDDLHAKVEEHSRDLAALMVTYPSTHGVFEDEIVEVCATVHDHGGQVYVDGANLNALVGLARPGRFGADVSHLNLHKTFCIPHGGGGPGVGPVAVRAHLAPYLPNHPLQPAAGPATGPGPVSAAPWGSAGILPISWAYVRMMGGDGLKAATQVAILNANYVAKRLGAHYPVLYTGRGGLVAHECIVDLRGITKETGVTVDDVAKRLIDYGFHAPTMSFPVAGTLMIEPTESEDLAELDRFCDAMVAIRVEIDRVGAGEWPVDDNPLHHAPHTASCVTGKWDRPYTREEAAFPEGVARQGKYWPPVRRIDGAYGDRHLVCSCPPVGDYA